jgi:hypothetical protein
MALKDFWDFFGKIHVCRFLEWAYSFPEKIYLEDKCTTED